MSQSLATLPSDRGFAPRLGVKWHGFIVAGVYIVLYVALDWLSFIQPVLKLGITPWNPNTGFALAFLVAYGPRWAPATAIGVLAAEVIVRGAPAGWPVLVGASVVIACGYAALATLLRRWGMPKLIESANAATRMVVAVALTTLLVALSYVLLFRVGGVLPANAVIGSVARYWVGDFNGILTLTPVLLRVDRWREFRQVLQTRGGMIVAQFAVLMLTMWMIFGLEATDELRLFYPLFVPVIWITLQWGVTGALLSTLAVQLGLIIAVQNQPGTPPLVDLQFLLLTLSLTALLLGAVVTERANALHQVAMQEAEQRVLLATAPDAVLTVNSSGEIRSANPAAHGMFGPIASAGSGGRLRALLPSVQLDQEQGRATLEGRRFAGDAFPAEIAWARLGAPTNGDYLVIVRDISERQRAENRLREREIALSRAMRFAVAGELASALAHELNQPITALVSYLQAAGILAAPLSSQEQRLQETLSKATHEGIRASEVLRRLRDFYRGGAVKRESLELSPFCATFTATFHERLRRVGAELLLDIPDYLPRIEADATQLEIVLHNLLTNAIDAVAQQPVGLRHIMLSGSRSDGDVLLRVEDSGAGVSAEVTANLFEPFMTSKVDGMGLGLAISRSLLRAHGGDLSYEPSVASGGACFIIRVPVCPSTEARS
jgi:signal transduction histidine kinase